MTLDYYFDVKRFAYLLKKESFSNLKLFIIALGAVSGLILIVFIFTVHPWDINANVEGQIWEGHEVLFIPFYVILGLLFTSLAYKDLLHVNKTYVYLTLPVSNFERMLSMLVLTTLVYTILFVAYFYVYSIMLTGLGMIISDREFLFFDVTSQPVTLTIKLYFVIQSIFLLGAAAFKKFPFLFTLLTIFLAAVALIIITLIALRIIFAGHFGENLELDLKGYISPGLQEFLKEDMVIILERAFWYVLAPVCWVITYLKLKEREV